VTRHNLQLTAKTERKAAREKDILPLLLFLKDTRQTKVAFTPELEKRNSREKDLAVANSSRLDK
jgi:hypothetical protein